MSVWVNRHLAGRSLARQLCPNNDQTGDLPIRRKGPNAAISLGLRQRRHADLAAL